MRGDHPGDHGGHKIRMKKMIQEINMISFWPETDFELVLNDLVRNQQKNTQTIIVSTAEI